MFVRSNEKITYFYVYVYVYLLIIKKKKKYKKLGLAKLEFNITRSSSTIEEKEKSITLEFCIYKELKFGKLENCVAWNSSLPSLSSM